MARKTKEEAQETRDGILDAATRVFYEKGVSNASLEEIARAADVTRGAVYWHFKNKLDLFSAIHDRLHNSFLDILLSRLDTIEDNPKEQLRSLTFDIFNDLENDEPRRKALSIFFIKCDYSGEMEKFLEEQQYAKKKGFAVFIDFFRKAQEKGLIDDSVSPEAQARCYHMFITGILIDYLKFLPDMDLEKDLKPIIAHYFNRML